MVYSPGTWTDNPMGSNCEGNTPWSFEQTMMDRGPHCYIPSFVEIGPPVVEIFEGFLPYMGMAVILVM